jgi:hypothetical protein
MHCLECADDASIARLHKWGEIWIEKLDLNVRRLILDEVALEIIQGEYDVPVFPSHFCIQIYNIPAAKLNWQ